jgi:hypothetical protein
MDRLSTSMRSSICWEFVRSLTVRRAIYPGGASVSASALAVPFLLRRIRGTFCSLVRSSGRFADPEHDDFRADRRAVVEIDDILVRQADAAGRNIGADRPGFIGAVDAV